MPERNLTALGFDFGTSWIGVAIGQTTTCTASPLKAIRNNNNRPDWDGIQQLITRWQPQRLIVGLPLKMNDDKTDVTDRSLRFSRQLEGRFQLKTELVDERLTTREAWQIVEHSAQNRISKPDIDSIAAVLITESWLHQQEK
jgi:putative Holliday junction resolvase